MTTQGLDTKDLLNAQTGKITWRELARHFARGVVVCVAPGQDLVQIADDLVSDQADQIGGLIEEGALRRAMDEDAIRWEQETSEFWAVVVSPWVLVQEIKGVSLPCSRR